MFYYLKRTTTHSLLCYSMMMQEDLHPAMLTVAERMIEKVFEEGPGSAQTPGKHFQFLQYLFSLYTCILNICQ